MQLAMWQRLLVCFLAGAFMVTSFAPFGYFFLSFICIGLLFACWRGLNSKKSFWLGLSFGYGVYGFGVSWVYVSLSTYGGMPLWMGSIAVLGFAGILAVFIGLAGWFSARFFSHRLFTLPFVWVIFEWMKSWVLTGFPWLDVGYSQTNSLFFSYAPLGGIYLVGFMVATIAACLVSISTCMLRADRLAILSFPTGLLLFSVFAAIMFDRMDWSEPEGPVLTVGVVQPNTPIAVKWRGDYRNTMFERFERLNREVVDQSSVDLIVWPETALPIYMQQTDAAFWASLAPKGSALLTGVLDSPSLVNGTTDESYNAAVLLCDEGKPQVYRKRHLVPFGEYLPFRVLFNWVLEYLEMPMSDFSSWQSEQSLKCGERLNLALSICYEDAFADEYRRNSGDASLLINISEDAWFGDSFAPHQRLQMAQMRAKEQSRPLVRSANSGPSVVIDHTGVIVASTGQFEEAVLLQEIQPQSGNTPFKTFGNWVIPLSFMVLLANVLAVRRKRLL